MESNEIRKHSQVIPPHLFGKAGLRTDEQRAYDTAEGILIETDFNEHHAVVRLKAIVRNDVGILEAVLAHYLSFVSTEMPDFKRPLRDSSAEESGPAAELKPNASAAEEARASRTPKSSVAKRGAEAIASVQGTMKRTLLDTYRVLDGRILGDILYGDLTSLAVAGVKEGALAKMIRDHVANADPSTKVRDIVKPRDLEKMIKQAEKIAKDTVDAS